MTDLKAIFWSMLALVVMDAYWIWSIIVDNNFQTFGFAFLLFMTLLVRFVMGMRRFDEEGGERYMKAVSVLCAVCFLEFCFFQVWCWGSGTGLSWPVGAAFFGILYSSLVVANAWKNHLAARAVLLATKGGIGK